MSIVIREMVAGDVTAMAALEAEVSGEPWSAELFAGELDMRAAERHWLVAVTIGEDDAELLIGFAGFMYIRAGTASENHDPAEPGEAHLMNIAVDPAFQRMRVARRLLHGLMTIARQRNTDSVTLEVRPNNGAARALYHRFGMESVGTRPGYYGDRGDAVIMWVHGIMSDAYGDRLDRLADDDWPAIETSAT